MFIPHPLQENQQKTSEDLQCQEDRVNHLNKVKAKLERSLDELEDSVEREKKLRADVEKNKRKVEGDLKLTQEAVADLERNKKELEQTIARKDKEIASLSGEGFGWGDNGVSCSRRSVSGSPLCNPTSLLPPVDALRMPGASDTRFLQIYTYNCNIFYLILFLFVLMTVKVATEITYHL